MDHIDFGGQRSKVKVTIDIYGNKLVNTIEIKLLCASSSNLAKNHGERMISIDFVGHRLKVKATMGIIDKCWVCGHASLCVVIFLLILHQNNSHHGHTVQISSWSTTLCNQICKFSVHPCKMMGHCMQVILNRVYIEGFYPIKATVCVLTYTCYRCIKLQYW